MSLPTIDELIQVYDAPFDSINISMLETTDDILAKAEARQKSALVAVRDAILDALIAEANAVAKRNPVTVGEILRASMAAAWLREIRESTS